MQLIDTHTHIYLPEFDADRDDVVSRAHENGVVKMLMPNIDCQSVSLMLSAEAKYHGLCFSMMGLHPTSVNSDFQSELDKLEELFITHKFIAIGEIGIDLYWDKTFMKEQLSAFRKQLISAINKELPVVIHARDSFTEVFSVLNEFEGEDLKGVFHAFTGSIEDAEKVIKKGFKLGIGGIVTFKNSGLDKTVKEIGPEHLILETDSPYLAPTPNRGKRNESSYICLINKKLAEIFQMNEEDVALITTTNSNLLFKL
jgi:TatD DNase family protein